MYVILFSLFFTFADAFKNSGQNIGMVGGANYVPAEQAIWGSVLGWFNEYKDTNMNDINSFSRAYIDPEQ